MLKYGTAKFLERYKNIFEEEETPRARWEKSIWLVAARSLEKEESREQQWFFLDFVPDAPNSQTSRWLDGDVKKRWNSIAQKGEFKTAQRWTNADLL